MTRVLWRAPLLIVLAVVFMVAVRAGRFFASSPAAARRRAVSVTSWACWRVLRLLSVSVEVIDEGPSHENMGACLFVCNHVSFLDIFVIGAHRRVVFVPSVELREAPVVGRFAAMGGSFFVERRKRLSVRAEIDDLRRLLEAGFSVALFPEGTTTNGEALLPFKTVFFEAAVRARRPVVPLCINYLEVNGAPLSRGNRDTFFYYGGQSLFGQIIGLMSARSVRAALIAAPPLSTDAGVSRKTVADAAQAEVAARHRPVR